MRIRWTFGLAACLALSAPLAQADDTYDDNVVSDTNTQEPGVAQPDLQDPYYEEPGTAPSTTTTTTEEVSRGVFASPFTLTPQVGALGFQDGGGEYTSRIVEGILAQIDFGGLIPETSRASIGLETGLLYSHVGSAGANFFGSDVDNGQTQGANSFLVPIELVAGWSVTDAFRTTLNFGSNMLYRSIGSSMITGRGDSDTNVVEFFPSVGLTAGWSLGAVGLSLRGDYIPVPADDMFTATLGAVLPLA